MDYTILLLLISLIICFLVVKYINIEPFESLDPAERGLVFGYLDKESSAKKSNKPTRKISSKDSLSIISKNTYFGFSNKNPLLPNFLELLGTFTPYNYENVKIISKNNEPIYYNKTPVTFSITYLHEDYYLQYLSNTSTFYLTKTPSYFLIINALDSNKTSEVLYEDTLIIKCLDNSKYLFVYDSFIVTEGDKSSTFVFKNSDKSDICKNITPVVLDKIQVKLLEDTFKRNVDNHILKLKNEKAGLIKSIRDNIKLLQIQLNNSKTLNNIQIQKHKMELEFKLKKEKSILENEINKYRLDKESEFNKNKETMINNKKTKWDKELETLKGQIEQQCKPLGTSSNPLAASSNPLAASSNPLATSSNPLAASNNL
jgi:hypothetical protein